MNLKYLLMVISLAMIIKSSMAMGIWDFTRDLLQKNIIGYPGIHQNYVWDFGPEQGKERRARFEAVNGRYGADLIERLGQGMSYDGPHGLKVEKGRPAQRYYSNE